MKTITLPRLTFALFALAVGGCFTLEESNLMSNAENKIDQSGLSDSSGPTETALFGGGCFWGVEAAFRNEEGVTATAAGYSGGTADNPSYREVCSGSTGHAEVVQVQYDPSQVSYERLLEVFWSAHDPTTLNRQGPDVGTQYRSAIFYINEEQAATAKASKAAHEASNRFGRPIVTEIAPATTFYAAEEYHQQYLEKSGRASCTSSLK